MPFQLAEETHATAGLEYIPMILDKQQVSTPKVQPTQMAAPQQPTVIAKVQQSQRSASASSQPASFIVVDDQQPGPSRQLKTFNPPSISSGQHEDSQHSTSGLSSLFGSIPSIIPYQQIDTLQPFLPLQLQPAPWPVSTITQQEQARPPSQSSQQSAQISRLACIKSHQKGPYMTYD